MRISPATQAMKMFVSAGAEPRKAAKVVADAIIAFRKKGVSREKACGVIREFANGLGHKNFATRINKEI